MQLRPEKHTADIKNNKKKLGLKYRIYRERESGSAPVENVDCERERLFMGISVVAADGLDFVCYCTQTWKWIGSEGNGVNCDNGLIENVIQVDFRSRNFMNKNVFHFNSFSFFSSFEIQIKT